MDYTNPSTNPYTTSAAGSGGGPSAVIIISVYLAAYIFYAIVLWRIFKKAGQPGWKAFIPIYNWYVVLDLVGRPGWWLVLYIIPIVGWIIDAIVSIDLAKVFGKSSAFGIIGIWIFRIIGLPILAFGKSVYTKPERTQ